MTKIARLIAGDVGLVGAAATTLLTAQTVTVTLGMKATPDAEGTTARVAEAGAGGAQHHLIRMMTGAGREEDAGAAAGVAGAPAGGEAAAASVVSILITT